MGKTYNTISTFTSGQILTATQMNGIGTNVNNYRVPPIGRAYRSSDLTAYTSNAAISFNASDIDTDSPAMYASGTTPLTIRTDGLYVVEFYVAWSATATVTIYVPKILINGTSVARGYAYPAATTAGYHNVTSLLKLANGDTVGAALQFSGGSNYAILGGATVQTDGVSRISVAWVGQTA